MEDPLLRRSFQAACMAPAAGGLDAPSQAFGSAYLATLPQWGLRPGSGEDRSAALQALIDTVSERGGGGAVILPREYIRSPEAHSKMLVNRAQRMEP